MSEEKTSVLDRVASLVRGDTKDDTKDKSEMTALEIEQEEAREKSPMNAFIEQSPAPPNNGDIFEGEIAILEKKFNVGDYSIPAKNGGGLLEPDC